jgi:Lipase (class 3)
MKILTRFSFLLLTFLLFITCKSRNFNLAQTKSSASPKDQPELTPAQALLLEDVMSKAFISEAAIQSGLNPLRSDMANMCLDAIPKFTFDGQSLQPDMPTLGYFALLSYLAYEQPNIVLEVAKKMNFNETVLVEDPTTSSSAYLFVHDKYLILSFAGTKDPYDLVTDLDLITAKTLFGYGVHKGFLRAYMGDYDTDATKPAKPKFEGIRTALLETLAKYGYPSKKIFITGHSLGAGLATLLSMNLAVRELTNEGKDLPDNCDNLKGPIQSIGGVVTFASSRVGGHDFAQCYQKLLGDKTLRVVNNIDFLPHMPDHRYYKHVGQRVFVDDTANITANPEIAEETNQGFFTFLKLLAKGGLSANVADHLNYYIKFAHALEPKCPSKRIWKAAKP